MLVERSWNGRRMVGERLRNGRRRLPGWIRRVFQIGFVDALVLPTGDEPEVAGFVVVGRREFRHEPLPDQLLHPAIHVAQGHVVAGKDFGLELAEVRGMNAAVIAEVPQADEEQAGGMGATHHLLADPEFRLDGSDPAHDRLSMVARGASARPWCEGRCWRLICHWWQYSQR